MGQCCKRLGKEDIDEPSKETELVTKHPLRSTHITRNDNYFTYFLGVFQLLELGEKLEQPEYIDELHPNFSYQKFNNSYHLYQKEILSLGRYIEEYRKE